MAVERSLNNGREERGRSEGRAGGRRPQKGRRRRGRGRGDAGPGMPGAPGFSSFLARRRFFRARASACRKIPKAPTLLWPRRLGDLSDGPRSQGGATETETAGGGPLPGVDLPQLCPEPGEPKKKELQFLESYGDGLSFSALKEQRRVDFSVLGLLAGPWPPWRWAAPAWERPRHKLCSP